MRRSIGLGMSCLLVVAASWAWGEETAAKAEAVANGEAVDSIGRLKPVQREEAYEFTKKPSVKGQGRIRPGL